MKYFFVFVVFLSTSSLLPAQPTEAEMQKKLQKQMDSLMNDPTVKNLLKMQILLKQKEVQIKRRMINLQVNIQRK